MSAKFLCRELESGRSCEILDCLAVGIQTCDALRNTGTASEQTRCSSNVAKCWLRRLIGSCDVVRNPSLNSDRDRRRLTALRSNGKASETLNRRRE